MILSPSLYLRCLVAVKVVSNCWDPTFGGADIALALGLSGSFSCGVYSGSYSLSPPSPHSYSPHAAS